MRLDSLFYRLAYRFGRPRWDTAEPRPELDGLLQGRRPGRALDLGCGTGTDAIYLASHGWEVTGAGLRHVPARPGPSRPGRAAGDRPAGKLVQVGDQPIAGPWPRRS